MAEQKQVSLSEINIDNENTALNVMVAMINIASFKVLKGYVHWNTVFMDEAFVKRRKEAGVKILAK